MAHGCGRPSFSSSAVTWWAGPGKSEPGATYGWPYAEVTIPLKAYRQVPVEPLRGKVVIDTNNYYPQRDGHIAELDDASTTSSELLQVHLPQSRVVKAFNNIYFGHLGSLQRPPGSPERSALPIAGDDAAARQTVAQFLDSIGYDAYDVGPLSEGWRYQPDTRVDQLGPHARAATVAEAAAAGDIVVKVGEGLGSPTVA
jgi:hypothetical protein